MSDWSFRNSCSKCSFFFYLNGKSPLLLLFVHHAIVCCGRSTGSKYRATDNCWCLINNGLINTQLAQWTRRAEQNTTKHSVFMTGAKVPSDRVCVVSSLMSAMSGHSAWCNWPHKQLPSTPLNYLQLPWTPPVYSLFGSWIPDFWVFRNLCLSRSLVFRFRWNVVYVQSMCMTYQVVNLTKIGARLKKHQLEMCPIWPPGGNWVTRGGGTCGNGELEVVGGSYGGSWGSYIPLRTPSVTVLHPRGTELPRTPSNSLELPPTPSNFPPKRTLWDRTLAHYRPLPSTPLSISLRGVEFTPRGGTPYRSCMPLMQ